MLPIMSPGIWATWVLYLQSSIHILGTCLGGTGKELSRHLIGSLVKALSQRRYSGEPLLRSKRSPSSFVGGLSRPLSVEWKADADWVGAKANRQTGEYDSVGRAEQKLEH